MHSIDQSVCYHPSIIHAGVDYYWAGDSTYRQLLTDINIKNITEESYYRIKFQDNIPLSYVKAEFTDACDVIR